ncbi:MAG: hypothetical protein EPN39_02535 [Chitinophagaceae bacterium]|jgi:hypothetical protein|nr:MAG: hypothetical protein EPN39_02535 [Chitinophagaceae bacterium]
METYVIELTNNNASRLLQDLEDLKIIKVLKKNKEKKQESNTSRFRGALKMSNEQYLNFQLHAKDIRNEWQENI